MRTLTTLLACAAALLLPLSSAQASYVGYGGHWDGNDRGADHGRAHGKDERSHDRHDDERHDDGWKAGWKGPDAGEDPTPPVPGDLVVYERVELFERKIFFTDSFEIDVAGPYLAILTDFEFPAPLKRSGLIITTGTETMGTLFGPGYFSFDAEPGTYYLGFFALAGNGRGHGSGHEGPRGRDGWPFPPPGHGLGSLKLGQFGVQVSLVPVPAAAWLLGSGLLGLIAVARRRRPG